MLRTDQWGHGASVACSAPTRGLDDFGFDAVFIALPFKRRPTRAVARLGLLPDGEANYDGVLFQRYRLTRQTWAVT